MANRTLAVGVRVLMKMRVELTPARRVETEWIFIVFGIVDRPGIEPLNRVDS